VAPMEFGPEGPPRTPDGDIDIANINLEQDIRIIHRAACVKATSPGPHDTSICGNLDELNKEFMGLPIRRCLVCNP
jgi:hypothetical protein